MAVVTPGLSNDQHRAVCYTDFWSAYPLVLPQKRHRAVGKETGLTNHIERFNIDLNEEEREMLLLEVIKKGRVAGYKRQHARILLKADINGALGGWTDAQIHEAFEVSIRTIERVRKCLVEQGMEAALSRAKAEKVRGCRLDGEDEAHLVALCCSEPPAGRKGI